MRDAAQRRWWSCSSLIPHPTSFRFLLHRLSHALLVLFVVTLATRALLNAMPGDAVDALRRSSPHPLTAQDLERLKRYYGVDDPFVVQYVKWLRQLVMGDLGYSLTYRVPVSELLWPALGRTVLLTGSAFVLAIAAAILLGLWSAVWPGSADDRAIRFLCYLGISIPTFWLGLVLIQLIAVRWRWLPPDAQVPPEIDIWPHGLRYLVLPVVTVAAQLTAEWTRYVRAGVRDVLSTDLPRALRARGLSERRIIWIHTLPNGLVPFLTVLGLSLPYLVGGELVTEMVFGWPGLGQLEYKAIMEADYPVAMATLLVISAVTLLGSMLADMVHAAIDPRVRTPRGC
jgi:peptide/nickel transport system permease protein